VPRCKPKSQLQGIVYFSRGRPLLVMKKHGQIDEETFFSELVAELTG
jgi:hypothetical protein